MQQSFKVFTVIGILFTMILGSLSHFFYGWSGDFFLVGLFSPVNESVWEHLKLLFFPALLFMLTERRLLSYRCPDLFCKKPGRSVCRAGRHARALLRVYAVHKKELPVG